MMIVASNSLTVSNVNDGTTVHIAYANSADGSDGFYVGGGTNLYTDTQNFNNLSSWRSYGAWTKTTDTYKGLTVMQTTDAWGGLSQYTQVKKGDFLTYSAYVKNISGTGTSNIGWAFGNSPNVSYIPATVNLPVTQVTITDSWQRVSGTIVATSDGYLLPRLERTSRNTNTIQIAGIKVEKGSVATPWSPAPSEAHPVYMGTYTDFNQADSTNPSDYTWSLIKGDDGVDGTSPINLVINSSNGYQFKNNVINTTFTAILYQDNKEIDSDGTKFAYIWTKTNPDGTADATWNLAHQTSQKSITITNSDVLRRATFDCTAESLN